ncbi:MAG: galactokinase [Anaerolineales bacterium]|nr:galactokinase [Anaerolineales bacterium]
MSTTLSDLTTHFRQAFGGEPDFIARAPGRVNLLGEHVDYNDGWVLPIAIDRAARLAVRATGGETVALSAVDIDARVEFRLADLEAKVAGDGAALPGWARYAAGVAWALRERGLAVAGLQAALTSDVPRGAGLSSSAAVEVAYATAWQRAGGWSLAPMELARLCQRAENAYVGVNCGIMDQFASACGQAGYALLLDCRTLEWGPLPLPAGVAVVVADTMVRRELGSSEYNVRRAHCEEAVRLLAGPLPGIRALRDVSVADFRRHAHRLPELVARRAQHVVEECDRTQRAVGLLRAGDAAAFGQLMNDCHASLRDLYAVSCPELDVMTAEAQALPGCYGARLTGAGFGGCTVNLIQAEAAEDFRRELAARYERAVGRKPEIYVCQAAAGAGVLPDAAGR